MHEILVLVVAKGMNLFPKPVEVLFLSFGFKVVWKRDIQERFLQQGSEVWGWEFVPEQGWLTVLRVRFMGAFHELYSVVVALGDGAVTFGACLGGPSRRGRVHIARMSSRCTCGG